ncbi:MAG: OPT family oligopeptide transporter [Myxococcota bacterium]
MKELSFRAVAVGLVLAVVMGTANVYLGLYAGMTVSASIPAAVVGMLVLRGVFRGGTLLEANQVQTAASAGESLAAGIIFTVPALVLVGAWREFDFATTAIIAFSGGLLGIVFMIPMRRVFVVGNQELPYPEGVACAKVLQAADRGRESRADARQVVWGGAVGAVFKAMSSSLGLLAGTLEAAGRLGGRVFFFGGDVSPALIGVGYIVRLEVAALIFTGGALGWLVCMPLMPEIDALMSAVGGGLGVEGLGEPLRVEGSSLDRAWALWSERIRYIGVGTMAVGGIASIWRVRRGLLHAVGELRRGVRGDGSTADPIDRDLPGGAIAVLSVVSIVLIAGVYFHFTGAPGVTAVTTVAMIVMAFFFVAVASYIVGLVGNSNSPVSGMTITALLLTGLLLLTFGYTGMQGMLAMLGVAAVVCCAACTSGDVCNDLKTGSLVGASPRRQQIMQVAGVAVASLVMAPTLTLLHHGVEGGIGGRELSAPQATLFAKLAQGFFGDGRLPWGMVGLGVLLGLVLVMTDRALERARAPFRAHVMPIAVGIYLPFGISVPILIGGILASAVGRGAAGRRERDARAHRGVLFSSGVIAGEALTGVVVALLAVAGVSRLSLAGERMELYTAVAAALLIGLFLDFVQPRGRGG